MLLDTHQVLAWVVVIGNGLAGAWALVANWVGAVRVKALWWFVIAVQALVVVQVVLGVAGQSIEDTEAPGFHQFYGFVALAAVGLIYSYRAQMKDRQYLLYGFGCLFVMGLGIRAMLLHW